MFFDFFGFEPFSKISEGLIKIFKPQTLRDFKVNFESKDVRK